MKYNVSRVTYSACLILPDIRMKLPHNCMKLPHTWGSFIQKTETFQIFLNGLKHVLLFKKSIGLKVVTLKVSIHIFIFIN